MAHLSLLFIELDTRANGVHGVMIQSARHGVPFKFMQSLQVAWCHLDGLRARFLGDLYLDSLDHSELVS